MDGATHITNVCADFLNVGGTDASNSPRRARVLRHTQRAVERVWSFGWSFKRKTGPVTISAESYTGNMPADYQSLGKYGSVTITSPPSSRPLFFRQAQEVERSIQTDPRVDVPRVYAFAGQSSVGVRVLYVYPAPSVQTVLSIDYMPKQPTITDASSPSGLEQIPDDFAALLYEMTVQGLMRTMGDSRAYRDQALLVEQMLADKKKTERPGQEASLNIPRFGERYIQ